MEMFMLLLLPTVSPTPWLNIAVHNEGWSGDTAAFILLYTDVNHLIIHSIDHS